MVDRPSIDPKFFRNLVEDAPEALLVAKPDGRIVYANKTSERLFGYAGGDLAGRDIRQVIPKWEAIVPWLVRTAKSESGSRNRSKDIAGRKKSGRLVALALRGKAIPAEGGALVLTLRDIAPRKRIETKLRETGGLLKQIVRTAGDAVIMVDDAQRIVLFNRAAEAIFGYRASEIVGRPLQDLIPERYRAVHPGHVARFGHGRSASRLMGEREKIAGLRKNGEEFPAEAAISQFVTKGKRTFAVILRDVTERVGIAQKLHDAVRRAEQANLVKSRFLANMNHELRTPLNAIIGFSEIIASEAFGPMQPPQYRDYIEDIHISGKRLLELVNNVLDMAKVQAEDFDFVEGDVGMVELLKKCREAAREQLGSRGLQLRIRVTDDARWLRADDAIVKSIVANLVSNACKFTNAGGAITISAALDPDRSYVLTVADTGVGMAQADIPAAFEPFGQIDTSLTRRYQGAGLGLTLTRAMVELHGGTLQIESIVGAGTMVTVRFPPSRTTGLPPDSGNTPRPPLDRVRK